MPTTLDAWIVPKINLIPKETGEEFVDLYCGPGGLSTGLGKYFRPANAVDINPDACATFRANHRQIRVYQMKVADFLANAVPKDFDGITFGSRGGVIGGPPCQGFSILNRHATAEQEARSARVQQLEVMVDGVRALKPRWVVIENVASVSKALKDKVVQSLVQLGYKVVSKTIHASDYGSVQIRRRWITIAHKLKHVFPRPIPVTRQAADIPVTRQAADILDPEPAKLLPAVVNPTKLRYVRPDRSGYLTKAELERAQGFPAGYKIVGTLSSWGQQLANAVPCELGNAIGAALAAIPS